MNNQELQFYGSGEDLDSLRKALAKTGVQESHDEVIKASGDLIPHSVTFIVSAGIVALIREFLKSRSKRMVSRMVSKGEEKITIRGDFSTEEFEKLLKVSYSINIEDDKSLPPNDLKRISVTAKRGDEPFHSNGKDLEYSLIDFWRWSVSDLVSNATRGRLAEFIVANALGISTSAVRDEWGAFDLTATTGLKVEVKSAAFLQTWTQRKLSPIQFLIPKTRPWDSETNIQSDEAKRQADIYVFALLAHKNKLSVDPLDVTQWKFYVLPTTILNSYTRSEHSITLKSLEKLTSSVDYIHLRDSIQSVKKA